MAQICVLYLSEDQGIVERLVELLGRRWSVWWAEDVSHGDWEAAVRRELLTCVVALPVLSGHARGDRLSIIRDEMRFAQEHDRPVLPFIIGDAEVPFGFGNHNRTVAVGWKGSPDHPRYKELERKLEDTLKLPSTKAHFVGQVVERPKVVKLGTKSLDLPSFAFSLSSHETQVSPLDGARLLEYLAPKVALVSAYDVFKDKRPTGIRRVLSNIVRSDTVLFLDSGNYEAYRKNDRFAPKKNPTGWRRDEFIDVAKSLAPDLAFSFDTLPAGHEPDQVVKKAIQDFRADQQALGGQAITLCPIVHVPTKYSEEAPYLIPTVVAKVASELQPLMIAVPERELGPGLFARMRNVQKIRKALDALGRYYPLHLLGTGNPLSMIALAVAGADGFDGLEWCRTVADNQTGLLYHFQQFDCLLPAALHRIRGDKVRLLMENPDASYAVRALSNNVDFFEDWASTMRGMIHSGQSEVLLRPVPGIGPTTLRDLFQ